MICRHDEDKGQFQLMLFDLLVLFLLRMFFSLCCVAWVLPLILSKKESEHIRTEAVSHSSPDLSIKPRFREVEIMGRVSFAFRKAYSFDLYFVEEQHRIGDVKRQVQNTKLVNSSS